MSIEERVFISGSGPAGLTAAAFLVEAGVPVTVFEALGDLATESRASTFHPPTLDMLAEVGAAEPLVAQGLVAPTMQYRSKRDGLIAKFDFSHISDLTGHPYRLQCEQFKLTRILLNKLEGNRNFEIAFDHRVDRVEQDHSTVSLYVEGADGRRQMRQGRWLIGADGARSAVRRSLDIDFEGFTWPERFLVVSTTFDFDALIDDLSSVSYVADPVQWHFLLRVPGMWRVMFPIAADVPDEIAGSEPFARETLATILPEGEQPDIPHVTLYRVHQRVAKTFRSGRAFLVGDAAHINNPLGGMGMNGGIHDSVNLAKRLAAVWHGQAREEELDRFDLQRRLVTIEYVQRQTIENKRNLEAKDPAEHQAFVERMRAASADGDLERAFLRRVSMLASLERAAELG